MAQQGVVSILKELAGSLKAWREDQAVPRRIRLTEGAAGDKEVPDPTPVEIPAGYGEPDSLAEMVQRYVRNEMSEFAASQNLGTFEEEDDFAEEDPYGLPMSPYEVTEFEMTPDEDMPPAPPVDDPGAPAAPAEAPPAPSETEATPSREAPDSTPT